MYYKGMTLDKIKNTPDKSFQVCRLKSRVSLKMKDKFCFIIEEASEYFHYRRKKLRKIVSENIDSGFVIQNGIEILIKRKRFEYFLKELVAI